MPIVLVGSESGQSLDDDRGFWPYAFEEVVDGPVDQFAARYDVLIPGDGLSEVPRLAGGARIAFHCTQLDAVERLLSLDSEAHILFQPNRLARLDRHRTIRPTLAVTRDLETGHRLRAEDLAIETGGLGMSADLKATVIGRPLLYDLRAGDAMDFGMIGERKEEVA
ncbi:MAG: hypothetical protein P8N43_13640 [Alphaproteobacteria bacterium]|jgi:hypothetical protein|nr:hypothetical protein [Alphaproteobacteria bacterium]